MKLTHLFENALSFKDESTGYHHGQTDMTLYALLDNKVVGYIEYSVYNDTPSIRMIEVDDNYKRRGYAREMLRNLQSKFPETEIDLGMLTDDGDKLVKSLQFDLLPSEYIDDYEHLERLKKECEGIKLEIDGYEGLDYSSLSETERNHLYSLYSKFHDLEYDIEQLEYYLHGKSKVKKIIK